MKFKSIHSNVASEHAFVTEKDEIYKIQMPVKTTLEEAFEVMTLIALEFKLSIERKKEEEAKKEKEKISTPDKGVPVLDNAPEPTRKEKTS